MSLLIIGRFPKTWDEYAIAIISEIMWCTLLAILFVYQQPKLQSKYYLLQGAGYGITVWLFIRGTVYFLNATELKASQSEVEMVNFSISVLYGSMFAFIDHLLNKRVE